MMLRQISISLFLSSLLQSSTGFSPTRLASKTQARVQSLKAGFALEWPGEEDAFFLMQRAKQCANSQECSIEDAEEYLGDVLLVQGGCTAGVLTGQDVCNDQDVAAEIVANLRAKIEQGSRYQINIWKPALQVGGLSLAASMLFIAAIATSANLGADVAPFTPQEWWWAARDGYLPDMVSHYFRNGGLAVVDFQPESVPLTLQEWGRAIQGGYLDTILQQSFVNGGLATTADYQPESTPFTPQEWVWAIKGGYLNTLVDHTFRNGGLASVDYQSDVTALTPEEWIWATKGGYLDNMAEHYYRNGGL